MTKNDLALKLGNHILDCIDNMKKNKKDFGQYLEIPFKPGITTSSDLDFLYTLKLGMPRYTKINFDGTIDYITMAEYFNWENKNVDGQ